MIYVNNDHFLVVYDDVAIDEKKGAITTMC